MRSLYILAWWPPLAIGSECAARCCGQANPTWYWRIPRGFRGRKVAMRYMLFVTLVSILLIAVAMAQVPTPHPTADQQSGIPAYQPPTATQEQDIHQSLKDVHFAFDRYDLTQDDEQSLEAAAKDRKSTRL